MKEVAKALLVFQEAVRNPVKDSDNPHFKSKFVNLDGLLKEIKQPLIKANLFFFQSFETREGKDYLVSKLVHISGEHIESAIPITQDKTTLQGLGSAITYLRRYSLESLCGICGSDDDDGNAGSTPYAQYAQNHHQGGTEFVKPKKELHVFNFGKHKGKSFEAVGCKDLVSYGKWLSDNNDEGKNTEIVAEIKSYVIKYCSR